MKTTEEMIAVMHAFADGKPIQVRLGEDAEWLDTIAPKWSWIDYDYRVKPNTKLPETWEEFCETHPGKKGEVFIETSSEIITYTINMITDNSLNDMSMQIINKKEKEISNLNFILMFLLAITLVLTVLLIGCAFEIDDLKHSVKVEEERAEHLENRTSIEELIGNSILNPLDESPSDGSVRYVCMLAGAWYPDIIVRQAKLESDNYSSKIAKENNNLFGMKTVENKNHIQNGTKNGYGTYQNWELSVYDRVLWELDQWNEKPSLEEYLNTISKRYATDINYIEKLTNVKIEE